MRKNSHISIINDEISDDVSETIRFLKDQRIDFVEMRTVESRNLIDIPLQKIRAIARTLEKSGIGVSALASPLFKWYPQKGRQRDNVNANFHLFNPNVSEEQKKNYVIKAVEMAEIFHTRYIRIFSSLKVDTVSEYSFFSDPLFQSTLRLARERDLVLLLENEPPCTVNTKDQFRAIAKRYKNSNLKLLIDIANFYTNGERLLEEDLVMLKDQIRYFHLKDFDFASKAYVPLGDGGTINYKRIFFDIQRMGFAKPKDVFFSLETHVKGDKVKATSESLKTLRKLLSTKRVSYGSIGCGRAFHKHALAIGKQEQSALKAVFDISKERMEQAAVEFDVEIKKNLRDFLDDSHVDVVNIHTPNSTHADLVIKAIKAGKYALCDKPLCLSEREGSKILKSQYYRNNIFVILQNRFNPAVKEAFALVRKGAIGSIRLCSLTLRLWRPDEYFKNRWHRDIRKTGGMLFLQGIHALDLMLRFCGVPKNVKAITGHFRKITNMDDVVLANVRFQNGIMGNIEITTYAKNKTDQSSLCLVGDKGTLTLGGSSFNTLDIFTNPISSTAWTGVHSAPDYSSNHHLLVDAMNKVVLHKRKAVDLADATESIAVTRFIEQLYGKA